MFEQGFGMNFSQILDSLSWRSESKILINVQISARDQGMSMTPLDLIACGLYDNDLVVLATANGEKVVKIAKGDHRQNDKITLHISPVEALNLHVSSGDKICLERGNFDIPVAEKVEIKRFSDFSEEIMVELGNFLDGKIIREGDLIDIHFHPDKGLLRENVSPKFKDMTSFPVLKHSEKNGYVQIGSIEGERGNNGCFLIDIKKTAIIKNGLASSRLPLQKDPLMQVLEENPAYLKILDLVKACFSNKYPLFTVLLHGKKGIGKTALLNTISRSVGVLMVTINFLEFLNDDRTEMIARLELQVEEAMDNAPVIICLDNIDVLLGDSMHKGNYCINLNWLEMISRFIRKTCSEANANPHSMMVVATSRDSEILNNLDVFHHKIAYQVPEEPERLKMLDYVFRPSHLIHNVCLSSISKQTSGMVAKDIVNLFELSVKTALERIENGVKNSAQEPNVLLTDLDISNALIKLRSDLSETIGAPKIPAVEWDDIGGLQHVKDAMIETLELPIKHPELFSSGLKKRSGILLYGPPGTGKTLVAKAVATTLSLNFLSVKGPELLNMYVGESEANVRKVFEKARNAHPCVVFFDELDSLAPKRGDHGDSGGVMDRIVSQLLAELDGMSQSDVFVIGATNRPDLLDPALLRPGR
jgi:peroxin-6